MSTISAGLSVASLTGQLDSTDVLLFNNPILTLLVDVVIGGTSAWAWQQEEATRVANVERIWDEVQRRRSGGGRPGTNRSQRRAKVPGSTARPASFTGGGGFSSDSPPPPPPPPRSLAPPSPPPSPPPADATDGGGLFAKAKDFFDEANELGRAQALSLNAQLEDAGVLPPVSPATPTADGAVEGGNDQLAEAAVAFSPAEGGLEVPAAAGGSGA